MLYFVPWVLLYQVAYTVILQYYIHDTTSYPGINVPVYYSCSVRVEMMNQRATYNGVRRETNVFADAPLACTKTRGFPAKAVLVLSRGHGKHRNSATSTSASRTRVTLGGIFGRGVTRGKIRWRLVQLKKTKGPSAADNLKVYSAQKTNGTTTSERKSICIIYVYVYILYVYILNDIHHREKGNSTTKKNEKNAQNLHTCNLRRSSVVYRLNLLVPRIYWQKLHAASGLGWQSTVFFFYDPHILGTFRQVSSPLFLAQSTSPYALHTCSINISTGSYQVPGIYSGVLPVYLCIYNLHQASRISLSKRIRQDRCPKVSSSIQSNTVPELRAHDHDDDRDNKLAVSYQVHTSYKIFAIIVLIE